MGVAVSRPLRSALRISRTGLEQHRSPKGMNAYVRSRTYFPVFLLKIKYFVYYTRSTKNRLHIQPKPPSMHSYYSKVAKPEFVAAAARFVPSFC